MHADDTQIRDQLAKFIGLLQSDSLINSPHAQETHSQLGRSMTKKLSVILSASEPESSRGEKENSNPSANRSFESNHNLTENELSLFECLTMTNLSMQQQKLVEKIREMFKQSKGELSLQYDRIEQLHRELQSQKQTNGRMINLLLKMDKKQKQRQKQPSNPKHQKAKQELRLLQHELHLAKQTLSAVQNDNQFMRDLIMHANQNYEGLERKYRELQNRMEKSDVTTHRKSVKKCSADNLLKSAVTKKKSHSPARSEVQHSPSCNESQQIYQRMILRTLKMKPKKEQGR